MQKRVYRPYISSLKGLACLFVMIGHFLGLVRYADQLPFQSTFLLFLQEHHVHLLFSEGFWLVLFFVISGYLCAQTCVDRFSSFCIKSICRFFRFCFPVFFASALIWLLSTLGLFHNQKTSMLFQNQWFQEAYSDKLSFLMLVRAPFDTLFFGVSHFNNPYYVLHDMMIASFIIYFLQYLNSKVKSSAIQIAVYLVVLTMSWFVSIAIILPCLLGMGISLLEKNCAFVKNPAFSACVLAIAVIQLSFRFQFRSLIFFSMFMLSLLGFSRIQSMLENRFFMWVGRISFGIYSFHWPLLCSIGSLAILWLSVVIELRTAMLIACGITVLCTILISYGFNNTFEKWSAQMIKKIECQLERWCLKLYSRRVEKRFD